MRRDEHITVEGLLIAIIRDQGHLHDMQHRLERKVDYLIEVAGHADDKEAIAAATKKLQASSDALDKVVKDTTKTTEP